MAEFGLSSSRVLLDKIINSIKLKIDTIELFIKNETEDEKKEANRIINKVRNSIPELKQKNIFNLLD